MKYLLVLAIVLVAIWYWRNSRRGDGSRENRSGSASSSSSAASPGQPQDMVQCPVCLVHLPRTDALPGPDGRLYCCAEHRLRAGG